MLDPQLKQAIEQQQTFSLLKVNIDELPELAQKYEVNDIQHIIEMFTNNIIRYLQFLK
jgi:thioredoxin-like negative regulator of GroEL